MNRRERLSAAAWLALIAHCVAGAAMLLVLGRGLETNPDLAGRLDFIRDHRILWTLAWLCWTLAGASILYFYHRFVQAHKIALARFGRLALGLTIVAIAFDWTAQGIEVFLLPDFSLQGAAASFLIWHRRAVLLTGGLANAFYTSAAFILILATRRAYPRWTVRAGWGVVLFGTGLTAAALLDSTLGLLASNAGLVPCLVVWLAGVALYRPRY